ncbi:MAG: hypothetical protein OHK0039_22670 [Bacteroidia bacterium]
MRTLFVLLLILGFCPVLHSQPADQPWDAYSLSVYASTNLFASPIVGSFEGYIHRGRAHWGLGTGLTYTFSQWPDNMLGPHAYASYWSGLRAHHFEAKLGMAMGIEYEQDGYSGNITWIPVVTLGYRYQRPYSRFFFRTGLGTGGIGVGIGTTFGR